MSTNNYSCLSNCAQQGNNTPAFLRTHPTDETRVRQLQALMPRAKAEFKPAP